MTDWVSVHDRKFYAGMAVVLAALVFAGFAPTFYLRDALYAGDALPMRVQLHGLFGTAWVVLFLAQTLLIAGSRRDWHRRLGVLGAAVAAAFAVSGALVIAGFERTHSGESFETLAAHVFTNAAPLTAFTVLACAGIWQRRIADRHKRLILLATVVLLPAAVARLFAFLGVSASLNFPVYALLVSANGVYDLIQWHRIHRVSLFGAAALIAIDLATTAWLARVGS